MYSFPAVPALTVRVVPVVPERCLLVPDRPALVPADRERQGRLLVHLDPVLLVPAVLLVPE